MLTMEDDDALDDPAVFNAREPEVWRPVGPKMKRIKG